MVVIYYNESCDNNTMPVAPLTATKIAKVSLVLSVAAFGLITNALALFILERREVRRNFGNLRVNLTLLSSSEVVLNFFIVLDSAMDLLYLSYTVPVVAVSSVYYLNINALLCIRNWCVGLIASSRCEAIIRPMSSRRKNYCQPTKVKFYFIFIVFLSYGLSTIRIFKRYGVVCPEDQIVRLSYFLMNYRIFRYFEYYGYFIYQSVLPVIIVLFGTIAMIFILVSKGSVSGLQRTGSRQQALKATRTILFLTAVFIVLEFPIFIITSLHLSSLVTNHFFHGFVAVSRVFVATDSCCNFFVYIFTNDRFKQAFLRLCFDMRHCDKEARRQYRMSQRLSGQHSKYYPGSNHHLGSANNTATTAITKS